MMLLLIDVTLSLTQGMGQDRHGVVGGFGSTSDNEGAVGEKGGFIRETVGGTGKAGGKMRKLWHPVRNGD